MATLRGLAKQGNEYGPDAAAQQNASGDHQENAKEDRFALGVVLPPVVEQTSPLIARHRRVEAMAETKTLGTFSRGPKPRSHGTKGPYATDHSCQAYCTPVPGCS